MFQLQQDADSAASFKVGSQQPSAAGRRVAILIAHGMGQQVPFETMDAIHRGLAECDGTAVGAPNTCAVKHDGEWIHRIETPLKQGTVDVHIYESYWAPLTEGRITLRDVIAFLTGAGHNAIKNARSGHFRRWLFGKMRVHPIAMRTLFYLLVTLATIGSLVVMNGAIAAVAAGTALLGSRPDWLTPALLGDLTTTFNAVMAAFAIAAIMIASGSMFRRIGAPRPLRVAWATLGSLVLIPVLVVIILAGVAIPTLLYFHVKGEADGAVPLWHRIMGDTAVVRFDAMVTKGLLTLTFLVVGFVLVAWILRILLGIVRDLLPPKAHGTPTSRRRIVIGKISTVVVALLFGGLVYAAVSTFLVLRGAAGGAGIPLAISGTLVWLLLIGASAYIRSVLVQYLGDVAIYVMPYKLDAFNDLRREIRSRCFKLADAVYRLKDAGGKLLYDHVIVVGHSLGSVVTYDVLNQLIREDEAGAGSDVAKRTSLFLTFGSPLDKTAFIFSLQGRGTSEPREALAASVQPMIRDYRLRPAKWINVWAPWDIISGHLAFYDEDPNGTNPQNVQNLVDPDATTPIAAHTEYWANPLVYQTVYAHL